MLLYEQYDQEPARCAANKQVLCAVVQLLGAANSWCCYYLDSLDRRELRRLEAIHKATLFNATVSSEKGILGGCKYKEK